MTFSQVPADREKYGVSLSQSKTQQLDTTTKSEGKKLERVRADLNTDTRHVCLECAGEIQPKFRNLEC